MNVIRIPGSHVLNLTRKTYSPGMPSHGSESIAQSLARLLQANVTTVDVITVSPKVGEK